MSDWTIVDLATQRNWDPDFLNLAAFSWPANWARARLGDTTVQIEPDTDASPGAPVIALTGFDHVTGALKRRSRRYQGLVYQVHERGDSLRPGDVLLPPSDGPVVFVSLDLVGSAVSARYMALRPLNRLPGLWLWAVLNSKSGRTLRRRIARMEESAAGFRVAAHDMQIPVPPLAVMDELLPGLDALQRATREQEEEPQTTWWTTTDLSQIDWHHALATPRPDRILSGVPLSEYCSSIERGRPIGRDAPTAPAEGMLPVVSGHVLAGRPVKNYFPAERARVVALPGDVLVAAIGERPNARLVERPMVVGETVYLLRLLSPELAPRLVRFLNGTEGLARRRLANRSEFAPKLNLSDLRAMRVPDGALDAPDTSVGLEPLDRRLEEILWPS